MEIIIIDETNTMIMTDNEKITYNITTEEKIQIVLITPEQLMIRKEIIGKAGKLFNLLISSFDFKNF